MPRPPCPATSAGRSCSAWRSSPASCCCSYWRKLSSPGPAGVTSEISALATYLVGALVARDEFWIATTLSVAGLFLLELKVALEGLSKRIAPEQVLTFTKFLLLTAVILPILPNREFGPVQINPFKTWLVVVAVSSISYGSYVIREMTEGRGGLTLAAVLGGAYSSTVTTVVLSREAAREKRPHLVSGATLMASGMMYLRLAALVGLFNRALLAIARPAVSGAGRGRARRGMGVVPAGGRTRRALEPLVRAEEPARARCGAALCAAVPGHADRDAPGDRLSRAAPACIRSPRSWASPTSIPSSWG